MASVLVATWFFWQMWCRWIHMIGHCLNHISYLQLFLSYKILSVNMTSSLRSAFKNLIGLFFCVLEIFRCWFTSSIQIICVADEWFFSAVIRSRWQPERYCSFGLTASTTDGNTRSAELQLESVEHNEKLYWQRLKQDAHAGEFIVIDSGD